MMTDNTSNTLQDSSPVEFNYPLSDGIRQAQIRTVVIGGDPWFVAKDVCDALGYKSTNRSHILSMIPDGWKGSRKIATPGGMQSLSIVSEQGLYFFIGRSDKPSAIEFQKWIAGEVLPTIRKTGGAYLTVAKAEELLANPDLIIGLAQQVKQLQAERDLAIRTKQYISDKKTATAMQTASTLSRKTKKLEETKRSLERMLGIAEDYKQVRALDWLEDYFDFKNEGTWVISSLERCSAFCN